MIRRMTVLLLVGLLLLVAMPAQANPTTPTITSVDCTLTITFTARVDAVYAVEIYDDGLLVYSDSRSASTGELQIFTYLFAAIGTDVPGVGIRIEEAGTQVFAEDPYTLIDDTCAGLIVVPSPAPPAAAPPGVSPTPPPAPAAPLASILPPGPACDGAPDGSIGATLLTISDIYYAPDSDATTGQRLEAGRNVRAVGLDNTGAWMQVHYACALVWLPVENLSPNFDAVWRGTPLPTNGAAGRPGGQ